MAKADRNSRETLGRARCNRAQRSGRNGQGRDPAPRRLVGVIAGLLALPVMALSVPVLPYFATPAVAQNLFAPRLYVNDQVITEYEVQQRARFMQILNAPGDPEAEAIKSLIDDRLRMSHAKRLGVKLSPEDLAAGMEEFAARANLTADQLIAELAKVGVAAETYRDFVQAGAIWRQIVRDQFSGRVAISDLDVDRYLEAATRPRAMKAQVSELVIPAEPGNEAAAMALATRLSQEVKTEGAFASAARAHSAAPTAPNGGRVPDWLALSNLPPALASQLLALAPGQTSAPVSVPGAVVLFQLRAIAMDEKAAPISVKVEWADLLIPDTAEELYRISAGSDNCLDLYKLAKNLPAEHLTVHQQDMTEVSAEVGLDLAKLDPGEFVTHARADGWRRLIMLCKREPVLDPPPNRDRVKELVMNQKLEGLSENFLEELRHAAVIREP